MSRKGFFMLIIENLEIEIALPIYLVENFVIKTKLMKKGKNKNEIIL